MSDANTVVLIPCYNEDVAVDHVVWDFVAVLLQAKNCVYESYSKERLHGRD